MAAGGLGQMMTMPARLSLCAVGMALAAAGLAACSASSAADDSFGPLAIGTWGSDSGAAIVGDTAVHLHIGCTFGDVSGRIVPGANGHFTVAGTYVLRAYPVLVGPTLPAQFSGQRVGDHVTITVTVNDTTTKQLVVRGPATFTLGAAPRESPCPICRDPFGAPRGVRR